MELNKVKLVTIITEAALESTLIKAIKKLGAQGYTISDARGSGSRGNRHASWDASSNIRIEVLCDSKVSVAIAEHLKLIYYDNYAMILFISEVEVLRSNKF